MHLRRLELKDAAPMLEWMHDCSVTQYMRGNFSAKTYQDAESFIISSWTDKDNIHLAIATDADGYMGTVSLKNIENKSAEFAITVRADAMGHGYAWFGMESIINKAFHELDLET